MSKLNVQELESRIAPGYGLFSFLSNLAAQDSAFGDVFNSLVDPETGDVDVNGAADVFNSAGGAQVTPVVPSFTLSDNIVISDRTASAILGLFGK